MVHLLLFLPLISTSVTAMMGCMNLFGQCSCAACPPCPVAERPVYIVQQPAPPPTPAERPDNQYPSVPQMPPSRIDVYPTPPSQDPPTRIGMYPTAPVQNPPTRIGAYPTAPSLDPPGNIYPTPSAQIPNSRIDAYSQPTSSSSRYELFPPSSAQFMDRADTLFRDRPVCQSRRWTRSESIDHPKYVDGVSGSSTDRLCNSPHLRDVIMKNIRELPENAKMSIAKALPRKGPPFVVICSSTPFSFVTSHESEYCYGGERNTHCYVFSP